MWADFLSLHQESAEDAAYFEAEIGGSTYEEIAANMPAVLPQVINRRSAAEESKVDGGSGGTEVKM